MHVDFTIGKKTVLAVHSFYTAFLKLLRQFVFDSFKPKGMYMNISDFKCQYISPRG